MESLGSFDLNNKKELRIYLQYSNCATLSNKYL